MKKVFFVLVLMLAVFDATFAQGPFGPPPPLPSAPAVQRVNLYPSNSITVAVGEVATIAIEVVLGNGQHVYNLKQAPVDWAVNGDGKIRTESYCALEQGLCFVKGLDEGAATLVILSANGVWGYRWVDINFVKPTQVQGSPNNPVDTLLVTFSSNQADSGDILIGSVIFPQTVIGPAELQVSMGGERRYFYFPTGVQGGQKFAFLQKKISPLEDGYVFVQTALVSQPGGNVLARGEGQLQPNKGFEITFDENSKSLKITDPYGGGQDVEYRVFLTRGSHFALEIPMRRFDLARGTELVYFDGMFGAERRLAFGRYTVTLLVKNRQGWEFNKYEANGLAIMSTTLH